MTDSNPVDQTAFTQPLIRALRAHVDDCAESIAARSDVQGSDAAVTAARPIAAAWVYTTVLVAWAEDHALIDSWLRADAHPARTEFLGLPGMTMSAWLARAITSLCVHPATACLLDPRYNPLRQAAPSNRVINNLVEWWTDEAPSLQYEAQRGPSSLSGWLPGDLLQHLSEDRRKGLALAQTPWWVADFILDLTLLPAADEFRDLALRTIDPACGTGHFLVRMIDYLWELYTTGRLAARQATGRDPVTGWAPVGARQAIRRILIGVHGCEKDPLTTAVARLRYVVTVGALMHQGGLIREPLRLERIPPFRPPIAVGDSLVARKISKQAYAELHPRLAAIDNLGIDEQEGPERDMA
jgi:hypothetical protein